MTRYEREDWDNFIKGKGFRISFPFVHIAGSNGKGSTAYYLYKMYRAKGYKVALFSKPYIHKPNEMILVNDKTISDDDFVRLYENNYNLFEKYNLSSFEIETFIAFGYFNEQDLDLAIIECGMGGETDSTNLLGATPLLSIITSVSLEHTKFLGDTLEKIALNKAGIIKEGSPTLVGNLTDEPLKAIKEVARKKHSELTLAKEATHTFYVSPYYHFTYSPYTNLGILSSAKYQLKNAVLAIEATKILAKRLPIDEFSLRKGLISNNLPCRYERHGNIVLDGAHNPDAVKELIDSLSEREPSKKIHVLFACFKDKNVYEEIAYLQRRVDSVTLTTLDNRRARKENDYSSFLDLLQFVPDYRIALNNMLAHYGDDLILVTGSLAFAYEVRDYVMDVLKL